MEKAIDNFMYKGKHIAPGMKLEVDAKDIPKLRAMGKIEIQADPTKGHYDQNKVPEKIYGTASDMIIGDDFKVKQAKKKGKKPRKQW